MERETCHGRVRPTTKQDLDLLYEHCGKLAALHHGTFALAQETLAHALENGKIHALVACSPTGQVVGSVIYGETFSSWSGKDNIFLEHLYVDPTARGHGYGQALLRHLASLCSGRIEFSVQSTNTGALDFYHNVGSKVHEGWLMMRLDGACHV